MAAATHRVTYKGETRFFNSDETSYEAVCEEMFATHGKPNGEIPKVEKIEESDRNVSALFTPEQAAERRIAQDTAEAEANGFALKPTWQRLGTLATASEARVARRLQVEHNEKPAARDLAAQLVRTVTEEQRRNTAPVLLSALHMGDEGMLFGPSGRGLKLTPRALQGLVQRMPARQSGAYLADCPPALRAYNVNHWIKHVAKEDVKEIPQLVLRTRETDGERHVFATVSPSYTAFDADLIGQALVRSLPAEARGSLDYNGERFRLEALWQSDLAPEAFGAGEVFKAGIIVSADDTGGGGIRVQSIIWRAACKNMLILDKAIGYNVSIRHAGSVESLATRLNAAYSQALGSIQSFTGRWHKAQHEDKGAELIKIVQRSTSDDLTGKTLEEVLPGIFNGIVKNRELVPIRGRRDQVVERLLECHAEDERAAEYGISRASIVNALTRYAHTDVADPFAADDIRAGAGRILSSARIPYLSTLRAA